MIGNRHEIRIERFAQTGDDIRQQTGEIFVLALSEPMPCHSDMTAEPTIFIIESGNRAAYRGIEERSRRSETPAIQIGAKERPVDPVDRIVPRHQSSFGQLDGRLAYDCTSRESNMRLRSTPQR